jgi:hypothetical protein
MEDFSRDSKKFARKNLTSQSDREVFALRRDPALDGKQLRWLGDMQQENSSMTNNLTWFCPKLDYR